MAKVSLDPMFQRLGGAIGNVVHYSRYGRQYCRVHVIPANPRTKCQQVVRATFADAVHSWQQLTHAEQAGYNRKVRYMPLTGYNLYISRYMKANLPLPERIAAPAGSHIAKQVSSHDTHRVPASVQAPYMLNNCPFPASFTAVHGPGTDSQH